MAPESRGEWRDGLPAEARRLDGPELPARVGAVRYDSRRVEPGDLFVCLRGQHADGHDHAPQAARAGAAAIVAERGRGAALLPSGVPVVEVPDPRSALASVAAAHEGYPASRLTVVGVTGTDGKSTTAFLALAAIEGSGLVAGLLSTVESRVAGGARPPLSRLTTPEAPDVQRLLAEMVDAGCTHAVLEASSHGLAQHRLDGTRPRVGAITTLGLDHLDFHGSQEAYHAAKARLFEALPADGRAVLNADEPEAAAYLAARTRARVLRYAVEGGAGAREASVRAEAVERGRGGSRFRLALQGPGPGAATLEARAPLPRHANL